MSDTFGLSPERVAFLLACPKNTKYSDYDTYKLPPRKPREDRYIMHYQNRFYFRVHRNNGKDICQFLGTNIDEARVKRDALLAQLKVTHPELRLRNP